MIQDFIYAGSSGIVQRGDARAIHFAPNLAREPVAFDAALRHPLRFREAISALHDVVISDYRFKRRDKTAYEEWKKAEVERVRAVRSDAAKQAKADIYAKRGVALPAEFERQHGRLLHQYWD